MELKRKLTIFGGIAVALAALALSLAKKPESSPVERGRSLAESSGCFACHGWSELDTRGNFRSSSSGKYRSRGVPTLWENGIEESELIKTWIRDGVPEDERERHERLLIQMPAYGGEYLSEAEIDDLTAWILAKAMTLSGGMGNLELEMPEEYDPSSLSREELFVLGDRLSRQQACYQCHGEYGQGGVSNPASFKGYIPGFFGEDLLELTNGGEREEIRHWIEHGRGLKVESGLLGRLAKRYFEAQAIDMPAYGELLDERELELLVSYLLELREMGPLNAKEIETLNQLVAERVSLETQNESL